MRPARHDVEQNQQAVDSDVRADETGTSIVLDDAVYEFPGCRPVRIGRDEIADYDRRYEFWDAGTETALMVCEPTSPYHERSSVRLARMTDRIAAASGIDIEVLGASDLLLRDGDGNRHRIMQADQIVYTRPIMARPLGHAVEVAADEIPDVVLEVDLTTDVRRGKLKLYEAWGFPEVWVEVPEERAPSRPKREPGLTIYRLGLAGYHEIDKSVAFPTWMGAEIHVGMNEYRFGQPISETTATVLRRVGRLMGQAAGSGPENDPFLRAERDEGRAEGRIQGQAEGRIQGQAEGRIQGRMEGRIQGQAEERTRGRSEGRVEVLREILRAVFATRGIALSPQFDDGLARWAEWPAQKLLDTARVCSHEEDFWDRLDRVRS